VPFYWECLSQKNFLELLVGGLLGSLLVDGSLLGSLLLQGPGVSGFEGLGERVQFGHESGILEWVLLSLDNLLLWFLVSENGLNFVGVDNSSNIGIGQHGSSKLEVNFLGGLLLVGSVDRVEFFESTLSPDDESSQMTSRSQLKEVQSADSSKFNSRQISEGFGERGVLVVDNQRSLSLDVSSVSHLSFSSSDFLGFLDLLNISESIDGFEERDSLGGFVDILDGLVVDNQGDFWDQFDLVSSGQNQSGDGGSGESRSESVSLLSNRDLLVPFSPGLGGGKHSSSSTHVSESSLAGSVSTSSSNTRNTGNSSTSSP